MLCTVNGNLKYIYIYIIYVYGKTLKMLLIYLMTVAFL